MKIFHGYKNIKGLKNPVAAIGVFDGVHAGHRRVINRLFSMANEKFDKVIITFNPHPMNVLKRGSFKPRIMSLEHKLKFFEEMGISAVIIISFTGHIAKMTSEDFVKKVLTVIGIKKIYAGNNFHFGAGREGNIEEFKRIGKQSDISVYGVMPAKKNGRIISSTWIRELVSEGELEKAKKLLNRPFSIYGTVVKGNGRGRGLGFPTANIDPHHEVSPPPGVYAVKVKLGEKKYMGVLNRGFRPTFFGVKERREEPFIEVNIFGLSRNIYGKNIEVVFVKMLREEKKFNTKELLIKQIQADKKRAEEILGRI